MQSYRPHPRQSGAAWKAVDVKVLQPSLLLGTHAVVTGAGSGIGRVICVRLAELGATVTGIGRTDSALQRTAELVANAQGSFRWFAADVRDCTRIRSVISESSAELGLDLLVNNAGGQFYAAAEQISDNAFRSVVDLNLNAVFTVISRPSSSSRSEAAASSTSRCPESNGEVLVLRIRCRPAPVCWR